MVEAADLSQWDKDLAVLFPASGTASQLPHCPSPVLPVLYAGGWLAGRLSPRLLSSPRCPSMSKVGCTSSGWYMALM